MPAPHHSVFLQAGCPSCRPTNSVKALKALEHITRTATGNTDLPTLFKRYHSDKHFSGFLPTRWRQQSTDIDKEQNYVTVSHPMYVYKRREYRLRTPSLRRVCLADPPIVGNLTSSTKPEVRYDTIRDAILTCARNSYIPLHGPDRTRTDPTEFRRKKSPCGSVRVRSGPCRVRVRVVEFS